MVLRIYLKLVASLTKEQMAKFNNLFQKRNILSIQISEKFIGERGRINCSLKEKDNFGGG